MKTLKDEIRPLMCGDGYDAEARLDKVMELIEQEHTKLKRENFGLKLQLRTYEKRSKDSTIIGKGGLTMKPIKFKEANRNLLKPASMTDEECKSLWVYTNGIVCVSCWKLSFKERTSRSHLR